MKIHQILDKFAYIFSFLFLFAVMHSPLVSSAEISKPDAHKDVVVIVDKKKNKLHLARNKNGEFDVYKTYHATLGLALGDKFIEGDLKTPEGIYHFQYLALPKYGLKPKFGTMALYVNYPNSIDRLSHKTGNNILLHGTDDPSRLEKKLDSKGCVVLNSHEVEEVWKQVRLKDTMFIITKDFDKIKDTPRRNKLKAFVDNWLNAWQSKNMNPYLESYAYEFTNNKMNIVQFAAHKKRLNKLYSKIDVNAENMQFFFHEKYDLVTFDQHYQSTLNDGSPGFQVKGKKMLYVQERNGYYRIIMEELIK